MLSCDLCVYGRKMKQAQADLIEEQKNNLIQRTANERTDGLLKTLDLDYFGTRNKRSVFELSNLENTNLLQWN